MNARITTRISAASLAFFALSLSACGSSDSASEPAMAENVEIPAEDAVAPLPPAATPVADPAAVISASATPAVAATPEPAAGATNEPAAVASPAQAAPAPASAAPGTPEKKM